jgi:hypothetical protein
LKPPTEFGIGKPELIGMSMDRHMGHPRMINKLRDKCAGIRERTTTARARCNAGKDAMAEAS